MTNVTSPKPCATNTKIYEHGIAAILVAVIAYVCFASGPFGTEFVYDDGTLMSTPDVLGTNPVTDLWYHDFWGMPLTHTDSHKSHRPLTVLFLRFVHSVTGMSTYGFRLAGVALHACASLAVFSVALRTCSSSSDNDAVVDKYARAMWAAALFASHPVHGDVVFQVVGCAESMCALLLLIALLCHLSDRTVRGLLAAPAAAMFAKEQGILATPTLLAYAAMRTLMRKCTIEHFLRDARHLLLATLVVVVVKMYFLVGAMPHYDAIQNPAAHADSFLVRMLSHNYVVGRHFLLLLWPNDLSVDWSAGSVDLVTSPWDLRLLLPVGLYAGLTALLVYTVFVSRDTYVGAALALLVVPFLPASNLLFPVGFVLAERVLYTPSVGFCMLAAEAARRVARNNRRVGSIIVTAIVAVYARRCIIRGADFVSEAAVFEAALETAPGSIKARHFVANLRRRAGDLASAEALYLSALRDAPIPHVETLNNLASLYVDIGRIDDAEALLRRSVAFKPEYVVASDNLAVILSGASGLPTTEARIREALDIVNAAIETGRWRDVCDVVLQTEGCFRWREQHRLKRYIEDQLRDVSGDTDVGRRRSGRRRVWVGRR
eukprot:g3152.t1